MSRPLQLSTRLRPVLVKIKMREEIRKNMGNHQR